MNDPEATNQPPPGEGSRPPPLPTADSGGTLRVDFHPEPVPQPPRAPESYYRRMMRRRMPWYVVAALFILWAGLILMERMGGESPRITADSIESSLIYFDRQLKMEDEYPGRSEFLRWVLDDSDISETLEIARDSLESYETGNYLDQEGRRALAVIREEMDTPQADLSKVDELAEDVLEGRTVAPHRLAPLIEKLEEGEGRWWDGNLAQRLLENQPDAALSKALDTQRAHDEGVFVRSAIGYGIVSLLPFIGLIWVPHTIGVFRRGWTIASLHRPVRYGSNWEPSLIVALLIAADLIAMLFYHGVYMTPFIPANFIFDVGIDTLWRLLAPGLALLILFRKPGHAIRSLGLNTPVSWKVVLAMYAVLSWVNTGFSMLTGPLTDFDPTGGLDPMENGWEGLIYGLLSACIIAPIAEEVFYRGILLRGLERRFGFWISASVVSIAFALGHTYDVFGLISVGILGFAMVVIYRTTGSLTTVIVLHSLYNLTITLPQWLLFYSK